MQQKFIRNLAFLIFINLLVKPFWIFGIDRVVQNTVGSEIYGLYFAMFNFSFLLHILLDPGLNNYNNRTIAQNPQLLDKYVSNILVLKGLLSFAYIIITFAVALIWDFSSFQLYLLAFLALNQVISSLVLYLRSNLSALHKFRLDSMLSVLDKLLMIILAAILLWGNILREPFKIEWFVYVQTIGYALTAIVCFFFVWKSAAKIQLKWNFPLFLMILKKTYPYALLILLMTAYIKIDGVMIERLLGERGGAEAGFYAAGYRILDAFNNVAYLFAVLLLPIFSRMLKKGEPVKDLLHLSFKTLWVLSVVISITFFFYKNELMNWLYVEATPYFGEIFGWLIMTFVPVAVVYVFGTLLTANGDLKALNWIAAAGVMLNIVLNYFLILRYNALGAAVATLITQSIMAIAHIIIAQSIFRLKLNFRLIFASIGFVAVIALFNYFFEGVADDWKLNLILVLITGVITAIIFRLLDVKQLSAAFFRKG